MLELHTLLGCPLLLRGREGVKGIPKWLGGGEKKLGPKRRDKSEKGFEKLPCFASSERTMSGSDEDAPAPSPAAAVLARRARREVKPMRDPRGVRQR